MTLRPALARLERGVRKTWDWARRRRPVTEGQRVTASETETMLGLMHQANAAGDAMSDEQRLLLIQAAPGMRAREAVLLGIPNRSQIEENELHMIRREMARLEGRDTPPAQTRIRGFLPALPVAAGLAVRPWMLWTGALAAVALWGGYNDVRAGRAENERDEALSELAATERDLAARTTERDLLAQRAAVADAQTQQTAAGIENERSRRLAAEAELRRIRRAMAQAGSDGPIDYGFGGVRPDEPATPGSGDGDGARPGDPR